MNTSESGNLLVRYGLTRQNCLLLDIVLFKISWALLVVLQGAGLVYAAVVILLRLFLLTNYKRTLPAVALVCVMGLVLDTLLTSLDIFLFSTPWLPSWLVMLWLSFALVLANGFAFLGNWPVHFQALAGMGFGSAGYTAGFLMGAVAFSWSYPVTMMLVALLWAFFLPLATAGVRHITGPDQAS